MESQTTPGGGDDEKKSKLTVPNFILCGVLGCLTVLLAWVLWPGKIKANCNIAKVSGYPILLVKRGDVSVAQENSLPAFHGAMETLSGVQADVQVGYDKVPFVFHDSETFRLTGRNFTTAAMTLSDVKSLKLQRKSNGFIYGFEETIPTLNEFLGDICTSYPDSFLYLNIRGDSDPHAVAEQVIDVIKKSPCPNKFRTASPTPSILTTPSVKLAKTLYHQSSPKQSAKHSHWLVALDLRPGAYWMGVNFWMATRLLHWYTGVNAVATHWSVFARDKSLLKKYKADGFCVGMYGGAASHTMKLFDGADFAVVDEPEKVQWGDPESKKHTHYLDPHLVYLFFLLLAMGIAIFWGFVCFGILMECWEYFKNPPKYSVSSKEEEERLLQKQSGSMYTDRSPGRSDWSPGGKSDRSPGTGKSRGRKVGDKSGSFSSGSGRSVKSSEYERELERERHIERQREVERIKQIEREKERVREEKEKERKEKEKKEKEEQERKKQEQIKKEEQIASENEAKELEKKKREEEAMKEEEEKGLEKMKEKELAEEAVATEKPTAAEEHDSSDEERDRVGKKDKKKKGCVPKKKPKKTT